MRIIRLSVFFIFILFAGNVFSQSFLNLEFDVVENGMAKGWQIDGRGYKFFIDSTGGFMHKNSLCIERTTEMLVSKKHSGIVTSIFPVGAAKRKKIVFSGFVKTESVENGYAGIWLRVDGSDKKELFFDNMARRGLTGTADWRSVVIQARVAADAANIEYGFLLVGDGTAKFNGFQIVIDGKLYHDILPKKEK